MKTDQPSKILKQLYDFDILQSLLPGFNKISHLRFLNMLENIDRGENSTTARTIGFLSAFSKEDALVVFKAFPVKITRGLIHDLTTLLTHSPPL